MVIDEIRDVALQMTAPQIEAVQPTRRPADSLEAQQAEAAEITETAEAEVSRDSLEEAIQQLNRAVSILNHRLNFSVDDTTGRLLAKIIDAKTNEVVREVPPERVLEFVRRFREFMGLLFDEQA